MLNMIPVIPKPDQIMEPGGDYILEPGTGVSYDDEYSAVGELICSLTGFERSTEGSIRLEHLPAVPSHEGYRLDIQKDGIVLSASAEPGFFYGFQTLRQLLPASLENDILREQVKIPYLIMRDEPQFPYRGFMLDSARHFFDVALIKKLLDLMALHKLNRFHWHLTDDQGWRIEIKKYPLLTEIGSLRKESQVGGKMLWGEKEYDGKPHSGFYTQDQITEVVEYAKKLHIEVIPEIDVPGHFTAALASYPQHSCLGTPMEVGAKWGVYKDILCAGRESSYSFVEDILEEVIRLFPYRHIHIGGDEVPKDRWKKCPDCQEIMKKNGIKNEKLLQTYFTNRMVNFLKARGFTVIGWDEIVSRDLDKSAIIQYWSPFGKKRTLESIKSGRKCIFSPFRKYYLDYSYTFMPLRNTYEYDPYLDETDSDDRQAIIGIEAPLWTEYVDSPDRVFWQMFPRLSAVSETAWTAPGVKAFNDFLDRFWHMGMRLDELGAGHASWECYGYDGPAKTLPLLLSNKHVAVSEYEKYKNT